MSVLIRYLFLGLTLFFIGCTASGEVSQINDNREDVNAHNTFQSLAEYLQHQPGVSVTYMNGMNTVNIRGSFSFHGNTSPLFVIDGVRSGHDFSLIERIVDIQTVSSIQVLRGSEASTQYGLEGSSGVILIRTNNN